MKLFTEQRCVLVITFTVYFREQWPVMLRVGNSAALKEVVMNFKISSIFVHTYLHLYSMQLYFFLSLDDMCDYYCY